MYEILQPPSGSRIQVQQVLEGTQLQWKNPAGPLFSRIFSIIFLTGWLGGWTIGGVMAARFLLSSDPQTPLFGRIFLACWLLGWAAGECFAIFALYNMLRPARPARLSFDAITLSWDPGSSSDAETIMSRRKNTGSRSVLPSKKRTFSKQEIEGIRLDRLEDRQRLSIDVGAERIEIGQFLTEPEREWLADLLLGWKES